MRQKYRVFKVVTAILAMASGDAGLAGDVYCIQPVYEIGDEGKPYEAVHVPTLATDASSETDACNLLVHLVGTQADHDIRGRLCSRGHSCAPRVLRKPMIRGGRIARSQDAGCSKPEFISQVNELNYPGDQALKLCHVSVSWDPANARRREFAYYDYYVSVGSGLAHVRAGDKNPNYRPPSPHQK